MSEPQPLRAPQVFSQDDVPPERPRRRFRWGRWLLAILALLALAPPAVVVALRWLPPPTTAFMLRSPTQPVDYVWVPASQHPQALRDAVIAAEDQKFHTHFGFDLEAIALALEHNQKSRRKRGASTITQQVAKNLFMWPSRSYLRKGVEASFTLLLELAWPKERILETYLNIAEFGPGTFGVEAAARKFFDKSAQELSPTECARLAAVLPAPRKWSARSPGPYVQRRIDWILAQIGYGPRPLPEMTAEPEPEPEPGLEPQPGPEPGALEELPPADAPPEGEAPPGMEEPFPPAPDGSMEGEPPPEPGAPADPGEPEAQPAEAGAPAADTTAPPAEPAEAPPPP